MYFDSGDWYDAAVNFELFLQQCPGSEEILLVLDKLGEAYENLGEIELSAELNYQFATPAAPNCLEVKAASKDRIKILAGSGR